MNKQSDRRFAYMMLLPAALILLSGCTSIPTARVHPAKPVRKKEVNIQSDFLFSYEPVSMVAESDYDDFYDMRLPCISLNGRYGITDNTDIDLLVYAIPVGFETYLKRCIQKGQSHYLSLELGSGCNMQTKGSNFGELFASAVFYPWLGDNIDYESIDYYYNNYYFFTGALFEYNFSSDFGFNTRLSGYCANVNIKTVTDSNTINYFDRLFFPQLGLSILLPYSWSGRVALNFDGILFKNPIDNEWYPGYNFGISVFVNPFSKKTGDNYE